MGRAFVKVKYKVWYKWDGGAFLKKIIVNKIRCNKCGDVIESVHRHDFKFCKCGAVAVDGGKDYLKRSFRDTPDDFTELSEYEQIE